MNRYFFRILYQGTSADALDQVNLRIMYSNVVYLTLPIVYMIFVLLEIEDFALPISELKWDQFIFVFEILICFLGLFLNRTGNSFLGKVIFLVTWPLLLHIIPIWIQHAPNDYFFAFPMGIAFHSMLIQLMISRKQEAVAFYSLVAGNFLLMLFSNDILLFFSGEREGTFYEIISHPIYFHVCLLYWLLFSLASFFIASSINDLFKKIEADQLVIKEQKEELQTINEELKASNDALYELNERISATNQNLEVAVARRTETIEDQNKKLREYAFFNAHKLRAPFCRVKGLLNLATLVDERERPQINQMLGDSIDELSAVISEIQEIVKEH